MTAFPRGLIIPRIVGRTRASDGGLRVVWGAEDANRHALRTEPHLSAPDVEPTSAAIAFDHVSFAFDDHVVLRDISFAVPKGRMTILLGESGSGKSVILRLILGLMPPDSGHISLNGRHIDDMSERDLLTVRADVGMLFPESALFDSLTVAENVGYRLSAETNTPDEQIRQRVEEVLGFMELGSCIDRFPSELSGGQQRRVAIARAMAARPTLLLLDDPTRLDPIVATTVDDEIVKLRDLEQVTCFIVTHQIRDAFYVATHEAIRTGTHFDIVKVDAARGSRADFMVLHEGRIHFSGSAEQLLASEDRYLKELMFMALPPW